MFPVRVSLNAPVAPPGGGSAACGSVASMVTITGPPSSTSMQRENSDVLWLGAVAVAVMKEPGAMAGNGNVKLALPVTSVTTGCVPRDKSPSPNPLGSQV